MKTNKMDSIIPFILKHFFNGIRNDPGSDKNVSATCNKCSKTLKGSLNATTNFLNHLKKKGHADLLTEYEKLKTQHINKKRKGVGDDSEGSILFKIMKQSTLPAILPKSVNFDRLLVNFLVDAMSPISIVENESFQALIEGAQQLPVPPKIMCRKTCNIKIAERYTNYVENTKEALKKVDFVCTTADIWSSSKRSYLGVTAHWIDCNTFDRKSVTLAFRRFKGTHSYDKVAELIVEIHSEFDLKLIKIVKTITDNGSNMVKALKIYGQDLLCISINNNILVISK